MTKCIWLLLSCKERCVVGVEFARVVYEPVMAQLVRAYHPPDVTTTAPTFNHL